MPDEPRPRARDARRAEFERIALPLSGVLYRTARRLTERQEDAADLTQETFLRAYRTFDNFQPGTNARAWLFTILYSIVRNAWRRRRRFPEERSIDDVEERFGRMLAADDHAVQREPFGPLAASPEVEQALARLPEAYRAAVLLVDVEELTYEEAATVLACPVGTLRSRLARARKQLFVALHDYARRTGVAMDG